MVIAALDADIAYDKHFLAGCAATTLLRITHEIMQIAGTIPLWLLLFHITMSDNAILVI